MREYSEEDVRMEIRRLDHVALLVKDVERSRRFYVQLLGMEEHPRPSNFDFPGAWLRKGSAEIHLIGEDEPGRVDQVQPGGYSPDELSIGHVTHFALVATGLCRCIFLILMVISSNSLFGKSSSYSNQKGGGALHYHRLVNDGILARCN